MKKLRTLVPILAAGVLVLATASPSQAAVTDYFKNHALSRSSTSGTPANISMSTTNPPSAGHIYSITPGHAGTGACVYASAARLTMAWIGNGSAFALRAGAWWCPGQTSLQITVRVYP